MRWKYFNFSLFILYSLLLQELADGPGPLTGFLEHGHVTCAFEHDEFRTGYQPVERIAIDGGNEAVILPPDNQRWASYTFQAALQPGIITRIPGQGSKGGKLAILREHVVRIERGWHKRHSRCEIVEASRQHLPRVHGEDIGNRRTLDADAQSIGQHQLLYALGIPHGEFCRHPAT